MNVWTRGIGGVLFCCCLVAGVSSGAEQPPACLKGECRNGIGMGQLNPYLTYLGQWRNGKPTGWGFLTYEVTTGGEQIRYEGHVRDGRRHGQGRLYFADGSYYVGGFVDDQYSGQGNFYFANGDHFEGQFAVGDYNGYGVYTFRNGRQKAGYWRGGLYVGVTPPAEGSHRK